MNIGKKIKELRTARNLSQEKFAEHFDITPQAVSKWENGTAYPDITLLPALATFFNITVDELLDFDKTQINNKVMAVVDEAYKYRRSNSKKSASILKSALTEYPNNEVLLNNLLYVLSEPEEIIDTAKMLLCNTKDDEIKYDVLRILAETYYKLGNTEMCKSYLTQIPELYFTKLELSAKLLSDKAAAKKQFIISITQAIDMLDIMGNYDDLRARIYQITRNEDLI